MSLKLDSLEKLLIHELKDLYSAETQILEALPLMQTAASDPALKEAFRSHLSETREQVMRLKRIFSDLEFEPQGQLRRHGRAPQRRKQHD